MGSLDINQRLITRALSGLEAPWPKEIEKVDTAAFIRVAEEHGILALLCNHQHRLASHQWPSQVINAMAIANKTAQTIEKHRMNQIIQLCQSFDSHQIKPLFFKGAANAYLLYEQPHQRLHADIDILIDVQQFELIKQTLSDFGFKFDAIEPGEYGPFQANARLKQASQPELIIDLHWKINNRLALADTLNFQELSKQAITLPAYGKTARSVSLSDALLIAALHDAGALSGEKGKLIGLFDAHLLIQQLSISALEKTMTKALDVGIGEILISYLSSAVNLFNDEDQQPQVKHIEQRFPVSKKELSAELLHPDRSRFKDHYLDYRAIDTPWAKLKFIADKFKRRL